MKLIVDTNIIISALLKDGTTRKLINNLKATLLTINFSDKEIKKYNKLLIKKSNVSEEEINKVLEKIKDELIIIPDELVQLYLEKAKLIMEIIDPDDTPFIAAALASEADIWSDDKHFKKQKEIKIWTTNELFEKMNQ